MVIKPVAQRLTHRKEPWNAISWSLYKKIHNINNKTISIWLRNNHKHRLLLLFLYGCHSHKSIVTQPLHHPPLPTLVYTRPQLHSKCSGICYSQSLAVSRRWLLSSHESAGCDIGLDLLPVSICAGKICRRSAQRFSPGLLFIIILYK
jgi:hypothetical protein